MSGVLGGTIGSFNQPISLSYVDFTFSDVNAVLPSTAQPGDIVFYISSTTSTGITVPTTSGYTTLASSTTVGSYLMGIRVLDETDIPGTSIILNNNRIILLVFRPNRRVLSSGITLSNLTEQAAGTAPTNQVLPATSTGSSALISFAHFRSNGTGGTPARSSSQTMNEVFGIGLDIIRYQIYNPVQSIPSNTITMGDNGTNVLQSFYLVVS